MSKRCSVACGFCGRCTAEFDRREPDEWSRPMFCGTCGKDISGPYDYKLSLAFGTFCGQVCADVEEKRFAARLEQQERQRQRRTA